MAKHLCLCTVFCLLLKILETADGLSVKASRACIIGAGYSGLGASRYMKEYGVNFTTFEATRDIGGTWTFNPHVGIDEDGLPVIASMYENLRTNTPRQTMEYTNFTFPEGTPSYPSGACFHKYLKKFVKHFDLTPHIQLRSYVTSVKWAGDHWNVTYLKTDDRENYTEACDFVVVANGQYSAPVMPKFEGMEDFEGKILHSCDYKGPEPFKNRKVLLVGAGASGLDLAAHLSNITSKLVHSHHLTYNQPNYSDTYIKKPDITAFGAKGVIFQDGSFEEIDDVILCTGYNFAHPFLDKNVGVTTSHKFVLPLYQHMVNIKHPSMVFIGVSKKVINLVFDRQGEYAAALAAGKFELPTQEAMLKSWLDHVHSLQSRGYKILDVNVIGDKMDQYFANLTKEADIQRCPHVITEMRDFNAVNRLEDILNYRDYDYEILDSNRYDRRYNPRQGFPCPIEDEPNKDELNEDESANL